MQIKTKICCSCENKILKAVERLLTLDRNHNIVDESVIANKLVKARVLWMQYRNLKTHYIAVKVYIFKRKQQ